MKRRALKWTFTMLTIVLALGCGPWTISFEVPSFAVIMFGGRLICVVTDLACWSASAHWVGEIAPLGDPWFYFYKPGPIKLLVFGLWPWLVVFLLTSVWLWYLDRRRASRSVCPCGYDLTGNVSGVCPECGRAIA